MRGGQSDDFVQDGSLVVAQLGFGRREQSGEARVAALVDGVAEPGQAALLAQHVVEGARDTVALGDDEELVGHLAGATVERAGECRQPGQQRVVGIGAYRGGHPHGHGRGGQLVVGQQDEGRVDRLDRHGARRGGEARREPCGDGCVAVPVARAVTDSVDQRGRRPPGGPGHGRRPQIGAETVGGAAQHQRPAHAVEGVNERAAPEVGRVPVALVLGPGLPEELGHVLEARSCRQLRRALPAVERTELLVELGHGRRDRREPRRGLAAAPAPRRQRLDVGKVEQAAPGVGVAVRLEEPAADVGIERRHLDPETAGRLLGREHSFHPWILY